MCDYNKHTINWVLMDKILASTYGLVKCRLLTIGKMTNRHLQRTIYFILPTHKQECEVLNSNKSAVPLL